MKYYSDVNLKGESKVIRNSMLRDNNNIDKFSTKSDLSAYRPDVGGLGLQLFSNSISLFDTSIGFRSLNFGISYDRGVFCGGGFTGVGSTVHNNIEYITISSCGNAEDFGTLSEVRTYHACASNSINNKEIIFGGHNSTTRSSGEHLNIQTRANSTFFNPQFYSSYNHVKHCMISNGINDRCITYGSNYNTGSVTYAYEYCTISTLSSGSFFGNCNIIRWECGGVSNKHLNRGIIIGGTNSGGNILSCDYFNFLNIGTSAILFGNLSAAQLNIKSVSNGDRNMGCFSGNRSGSSNAIDYIRISFPSNSAAFGSLLGNSSTSTTCDNGVNNRGVFLGTYGTYSGLYDQIEFITISHYNSANHFGNLHTSHYNCEGTSNS